MVIDVDPTCFVARAACITALIDVSTADFTDVAGNHWVTGVPLAGHRRTIRRRESSGAVVSASGNTTSPFLALTSDTNGCDGTLQLMFECQRRQRSFGGFPDALAQREQ